MAILGINFDANQVEPAIAGGSQLPVSDKIGWPVMIVDSQMTENKNKDGGFLELTLQIIDGEHKGVEGVYRINLFNKNEKTVEIAYKQLSAICYVTGVMQLTDSAILHNRPFRAIVGLQRDEEAAKKGYTEVKGVLDINGNQPGKSGAPAAAAAPPNPPPAAAAPVAPAASAAAPWGGAAPVETPAGSATPVWGGQPAAGGAPPWASKP